jgi:5-methylcytosine-specific restriction endonuclease McrA
MFELTRLENYDDESLIKELQRVALLVEPSLLTKAIFDKYAKASSSILCTRFGSWEEALNRASLTGRYSGGHLATNKPLYSDDELILELQRVSIKLEGRPLTRELFNDHALLNSATVCDRFGSWKAGLARADLSGSKHGLRHSETDYFENLLTVWTYKGRQPSYGEMSIEPSKITASAYERRWGKWRLALRAFLDHVNMEGSTQIVAEPSSDSNVQLPLVKANRSPRSLKQKGEDQRSIRLGMRYEVLKRDRFRCALCGASPSTLPECILHVDHIHPFSKGGKTITSNLRALCQACNLGKSSKIEIA